MKKIAAFIILVFLSACTRIEKSEQKDNEIIKDYPNLSIQLTDGSTINGKALEGEVLLIIFQPDCDHCQHEAQEIEENIAAFRDHTLYFVSSSPMEEVKRFATEYKLAGIPNVKFGWTTTESIINNFGPIQTPSVYIYSSQGKLIKHFNGQVAIGEILRYL